MQDPDNGWSYEANLLRYTGGWDNNHPWSVTPDLFKYLTDTKGYEYGTYSYDITAENISVSVSDNFDIRKGDVVFYDKNNDGMDHAMICVGVEEQTAYLAYHTPDAWWVSENEFISGVVSYNDVDEKTTVYVVYMTTPPGR